MFLLLRSLLTTPHIENFKCGSIILPYLYSIIFLDWPTKLSVILDPFADFGLFFSMVIRVWGGRCLFMGECDVPLEVVPPTVALPAHMAGVRPDALVDLPPMLLQTVKLGKCLAAYCSIFELPGADLISPKYSIIRVEQEKCHNFARLLHMLLR